MVRSINHHVPAKLLKPMWLRSRESMVDDGVIYDPVAAATCQSCILSPDCQFTNIDQGQLLHATLTSQCDEVVKNFLKHHPTGWIVNVDAGLDTRFYRLDNGRCRWLEVDVDENLLWRERLFHRSERYQMVQGSVRQLGWLNSLGIPSGHPTMLICDQALLNCNASEISSFCNQISRRFPQVELCLVLAGDKCNSVLGRKLGCEQYDHGFSDPRQAMMNALPWASKIELRSPLDKECHRWRVWQRFIASIRRYRYRMTPVVVHVEL